MDDKIKYGSATSFAAGRGAEQVDRRCLLSTNLVGLRGQALDHRFLVPRDLPPNRHLGAAELITPPKGLIELVRIKNRIGDILGIEADVMTRHSLHPSLKEQIEASAVRVF